MSPWHKHEWDFLPERAFSPRPGGGMTLEGGKGSSAPAPDPELIKAQIKSLGIQDKAIEAMLANSDAMRPLQMQQMQFGLDASKAAFNQANEDRAWSIGRRDKHKRSLQHFSYSEVQMNVTYIRVLQNGCITACGATTVESVDLIAKKSADELIVPVEWHVDPTTNYYANGEVVPMPERPSPNHAFDYDAKAWVPSSELALSSCFIKRSQLLSASDWTQLPDVPLATKEAWATYRQALRDITDQPGYPLDVVWPVAPG